MDHGLVRAKVVMADFSSQDVPNRPGVYIFRNRAGEVIYVGKARSLRKRLSSYFQPSKAQRADAKLRALINSIQRYETIEVATEAEALLLESRLIKQYHPRYNVELRDDRKNGTNDRRTIVPARDFGVCAGWT